MSHLLVRLHLLLTCSLPLRTLVRLPILALLLLCLLLSSGRLLCLLRLLRRRASRLDGGLHCKPGRLLLFLLRLLRLLRLLHLAQRDNGSGRRLAALANQLLILLGAAWRVERNQNLEG